MTDIEAKVMDIVSKYLLCGDEITLESSLEELGKDSLDKLAIIIKVELEFGIDIADSDVAECRTVADIAECVNNYLSQ